MWAMDTTVKPKTKVEPNAFGPVYFGVILLLIGIVMTLGPLTFTGLLVGGMGIAMVTVGMLHRYR